MKNLLNFLIKYNYWFLFLLLEATSFVLLFRFNYYQGSVFFTSANQVVGTTYEVLGGVSSYFHLKTVNKDLMDKNLVLEQQVEALQRQVWTLTKDSTAFSYVGDSALSAYRIIPAEVVNNSVNRLDNYITLNKGTADGVRSEMGVVDGNGVVGIIYQTSSHYSVAISTLNSKSSINCKIKGSDYFGYLKWEGGSSEYAYVKDLPRHAQFELGDTVVTNGYSSVFPAGILVGTIAEMSDSHDGLSYLLRVKLATDFGRIGEVRIISHLSASEQKELEQKARK